ncbi:SnoaL-like domain-containing protein [Lutibacter oricola]|uniref:SnoaL-like domain-containing protein n=1 Tax=Lutibacter oricola TaxID=762486 RepID=A0A1H3DU11_9FLAO|nr:nuclear transport factor 2 family protein [Lutibacter oricola]SDX70022.1 SnoaL-like domain-containing protein [Lutibacter oricola]
MKKVLYLILISFTVLVGCKNNEKAVVVDKEVEKEVICDKLDKWHENAAKADYEAYFNGMTTDGVFIGTDVTENWTIDEFKSFSKPHFDKGKAWSFKAVDRNIYIYENNELAWFDEVLDTWMGVCRGSGVVKKVNSQWKIQHYVLSLTIPNDNINNVIKINKKKDSLFLKKFFIH